MSVFDICTFKFLCEERKEPSTVNCHTSIVSLSERRDGFESMNPALWCYFTEFRLCFSVCVIHMLPETKTGLESSCESFDLVS